MSDARLVALRVLEALETRDAFLQQSLAAEARRAHLDPRDRGLALELVQGVSRFRLRLDHALSRFVKREAPPHLRDVLRLGAYQLLFLDRVPARAAVHTAVNLARRSGGEKGARFVNAVLRSLGREGEALPTGDDAAAIAVRTSHPRWLIERWLGAESPALVEARAEASNRPAPLTVRPDQPGLDVEALAERLQAEGGTAERGRYAPEALHLSGLPAPFETESFGEGAWLVQDEAAQLIGHLLDPRPGDTVWDVCAAPGGKTRHLARMMRGEGLLLATDVHPGKVKRLARRAKDLPVVQTEVHDATFELEGHGPFDRVLLDAPCSGLGVIRRHPEIRWRRTPGDVDRMATAQAEMLEACARAVKPGGILVYSVCTETDEEGPAQIARFLAEHPDFERAPPPDGLDWAPLLEGEDLRTRPDRHGADGFYAARLQRKAS